jgi:hypothetical protein
MDVTPKWRITPHCATRTRLPLSLVMVSACSLKNNDQNSRDFLSARFLGNQNVRQNAKLGAHLPVTINRELRCAGNTVGANSF